MTSDELPSNTRYTRYIRMKEQAENRTPEIVSEESQYDNERENCEVIAKENC